MVYSSLSRGSASRTCVVQVHVFGVRCFIIFLICHEASVACQSSLFLNIPTPGTDGERAPVYHSSRQVWALGEGGWPGTQRRRRKTMAWLTIIPANFGYSLPDSVGYRL